MEKSTKKNLIIFSSIMIIAGVGGYLLWKRKKDKDSKTLADAEKAKQLLTDTGATPASESSTTKPTSKPNPTTEPKTTTSTTQTVADKIVSTTDLLAYNANGANGKIIYASGGTVFNMQNVPVSKPKKGSILGTVHSVKMSNDKKTYWVTFTSADKIRYKTAANGTTIKN